MRYWLLAIYGVLAALIVLAVLYFVWEPMRLVMQPVVNWISARLSGIDLGSFNLSQLVTENIPAVIGLSATGIGALITYVKYRGQIAANEKLLEMQKELNFKNAGLETDVKGLANTVSVQAVELGKKTDELQMYSEDQTAEILQRRINELQSMYEDKIASLNRQLQETKESMVTPEKIDELIKVQKQVP